MITKLYALLIYLRFKKVDIADNTTIGSRQYPKILPVFDGSKWVSLIKLSIIWTPILPNDDTP